MTTGAEFLEHLVRLLPPWLAWPMSALSTLAGFVGAGLILFAAATGSVPAAVWAGVSFLAAAIFWHIAEFAGDGG